MRDGPCSLTLPKSLLSSPNWISAPVWINLFVLRGIPLFFVWQSSDHPQFKHVLIFFFIQLVLPILWSAVLFELRSPLPDQTYILFLLFAILFTILNFFKLSKFAGIFLIPYLWWEAALQPHGTSLSGF